MVPGGSFPPLGPIIIKQMELKIPRIGSENEESVLVGVIVREAIPPLIPWFLKPCTLGTWIEYHITAGDLLHKWHPVRLNFNLAKCFLPIGPVTESLVNNSTFQLGQLLVGNSGSCNISYVYGMRLLPHFLAVRWVPWWDTRLCGFQWPSGVLWAHGWWCWQKHYQQWR